MLKLSCQTRGDSIASLKFFVQPVPMSAFDMPIEDSAGQSSSGTPPHQSYASDPQNRLAHAGPKPQPPQLERAQKQLNRRSSSPHLLISSGDSTLKQSDITGSAEALPDTGTNGLGNQPRDDLDDLRERLALLRRHQDQGPKINVIPTPGLGPTPPGPHSSVQPSPNDPIPEPGSAYPSYTGWENDYSGSSSLNTLVRTTTDGSPSDNGLSPAVRKNELFFDEDPSPITTFATLTHGPPHKGSAGTNQLGAAAQVRRQGLESIAQQQQQEQQTGWLTKKKKDKETDTERPSAGFQKVQTVTRPGRVVDFDNPRPSPYEDVKMETLIPQRKPPPPPSNRSSIGSISRVGSDFGRGLPADVGGRYAPATRRVSIDRAAVAMEKAPEMSERTWRKGVSPLHEDRQSPVTGIGSSLISAGILSAQITRTPIPGMPRESVSAPSLPLYNQQATPHQQQQYQQQGQQTQESPRPRAMATVDFGHSGTSSPQSGGTPSSPAFTWGKGNQCFKIPDYQPEYETGPEKLTLQIPAAPLPRPSSPEISPGDRDVPLGIRKSTLPVGAPIDIQGNDVQFLPQTMPTSAEPRVQEEEEEEDEDSDEDDGLFAIPISSRGEKPKTEFPKTEERNVDSPRPTLTIATKNVTFKATPTTSATASGSNGAMNSPEFEQGDDKWLNSPASHNISTPGSAAASAHSPADYTRLGRRESFGKDDVWASRPPAEALIDHLDDFFPGLNLDQPIPDEVSMSPPPSPSPATENKPQSYQLADIPSESPNTSEPPGAMGPPPPPVSKGKNTPTVVQRNLGGRSQLGRMKSIREVARGAHEKSKRFTQTNTAGLKSGDIIRRKSTKMFGARLIEVTPTKRGAMLQAQQASPPVQQQSGIKRQATFRWFKGQLIGKGTYGRVYLGMNATTGEFLAVKQVEVSKGLSANDSDRQKEMIAALNQEIETMQHLDHVNIVQYLGCERKEMNMSIFLEYISGGSVGSCLRKHGPFEESVVRSLTRQTLSGLEYLHREGILHRDLKADNILLDIDGTCKISDFGISKKSGK